MREPGYRAHEEDFITMKPERFRELMARSNALAAKRDRQAAEKEMDTVLKVEKTVPKVEKTVPKVEKTVPKKKTVSKEVRTVAVKKKTEKRQTERYERFDDAVIGRQFGKLTVLSLAGKNKAGHTFLCRCECGTETVVSRKNLVSGNSRSCGCVRTLNALASPENLRRYRKRLLKAGYDVDTNTGIVWYDSSTHRSNLLEISYPGTYEFRKRETK